MGKLFWKFFLFILLAQLTAAIGVGGALWLRHRQHDDSAALDRSPPAAVSLEAASSALQLGGVAALRRLIPMMGPHPVIAVDAGGRELDGRTVPPALLASARQNTNPQISRSVSAPDGQRYLLFSAGHGHRGGGGPPRDEGRRWLLPLLAATLASLLFAALLARYFFRPIGLLRDAFGAAAGGNLQPQLAQTMGARSDALADLGRDFDRMAQQLRTLMDGQRRLLHHVSHELRSPLARQQIAIGLARRQPERIAALLERIERDGQRMDQLVGAVLVLSRLESGISSNRPDDVAIDELLAGIVADAGFEGAPDDKHIVLAGHSDTTLRGNLELLHSALENIVRNAVKHSPPGGVVRVTVARTASAVQISVVDRGPGVPAHELEAIFEPFFRSADSGADGHGLGLAIARQVVQSQGGSVVASNHADGGLQVLVSLPPD